MYDSQEYFVKLENNEHLLGRLVVNRMKANYNCEIDIVHFESKKIYTHVDILYNIDDFKDAVHLGHQRLAMFLRQK